MSWLRHSQEGSECIMDDKNLDAVKGTLKAFGVNADKMSDAEVKQLRQKIADFYTKNDKAVEEARSGKKVGSKKNDSGTTKKKSSGKKSSKKKDDKKATQQTGGGGLTVKKKTSGSNAVSKSVYDGGDTKVIKERRAKKRREAMKNSRYEGGVNGKNKKKLTHSIDFITDDYLEHHGILGQKWGVRRFQKADGTRTPAGKKRESTLRNQLIRNSGSRKSKALSDARKKDINKLSTNELKAINDRLQAERNYADLTKGSVSAGKKYLGSLSQQITTAIITGIVIEAGKRVIKNKFGI